jgi:hypothetical protein
MPEPYGSIIAVLYVVGTVLLLLSLPSRLKAKRTHDDRKNAVLAAAPASKADASAVSQMNPARADRVVNVC